MKISRIAIFLLLMTCPFLPKEGWAQDSVVTNGYFRVISGYRIKDTSFIIIRGGAKLGIKQEAPALAYSIYTPLDNGTKREFTNIGYGKVVRVFPDSAVCMVNQAKTGSHNDSILLGDVIQVKVKVARKPYPELCLDLARLSVYFSDEDGGLLYDHTFIYTYPSPVLDSFLIDYVLKDMKKTYQIYKDKVPASMYEPIREEGRFKGRIPMNMLTEATAQDVRSFLMFVRSYPGRYIGNSKKFAEVFITWTMNGGGYSRDEVFDGLYRARHDAAAFDKALLDYKPSITGEDMVSSFADSITEAGARGDRQLAEAYMAFLWKVADKLKDTAGKANLMVAMKNVEVSALNYRKAAAYCDSTIYYARLGRLYELELDAYLNKVEAFVQLPQMDLGRKTLADMAMRVNALKLPLGADQHHHYNQLMVQYDGWLNYMDKNYGRAIEKYTLAATLNNSKGDKSYWTRTNNALIFKQLGRIYKEQGRSDLAIQSFTASANIYDSINNRSEKAWLWNEIGAANYNLGKYPEAMRWFTKASALNTELGSLDNLGYGVSMTANCYWMLGKIDSAIELHKQAIAIRRDVNETGTAYSWDQLGQLYQVNAFKTLALAAYDSSRLIYERLRDSASLSDNYLNVGLVYHGDENYRKAIGFYEKSVSMTPKASSAALFDIGLAWSALQKKNGIAYFERAEKATDSARDLALQFKVLRYLSADSYMLDELEKGDRWYAKMQKLMKDIASPSRKAMLMEVRAVRSLKKGDLDSSYAYYDAARAIYDTVNKLDAVGAMLNMADVLTTKGSFDEAIRWMDKALTYSRISGSPLGAGVSYNGLSFLYAALGQLDKAMECADSAAVIFGRTGNELRYASAMIQKGNIHKDKGDYKTALERINYADSVYVKQEAMDNRRTSLNNAGVVYFNQADYNRAIEYFKRAEQYFDKADINEDILINRANIAECYYNQKKYKEAQAIYAGYYQKAMDKGFKRIGVSMANVQSSMYFDMGDMKEAERFANEVQKFATTSGALELQMDASVMQGKVSAARGDVKTAEQKIRSALSKGIERWTPYYEMGMVFYQQKKYDSAIAYFRTAVEIVERNAGNVYGGDEARKMFSSDPRKVDLYNKIIASYVALKDPAKASEYALRNSITAINSKYGKDLGFADSTLRADIAKAEELRHQIDAVDVSIAKADSKEKKEALLKTKRILEEGYQNFLDERKEKYNDFEKFMKGNVNPEDLSNFKGGLPEDMAVVSYVVNDSQLYKFIVTNATLEITTTVLEGDINVMINDFIASLITPDSASGTGSLKVRAEFVNQQQVAVKPLKQTSEALYRILIEDIKPIIGDKKKLCIIPSGKLNNIPFQCLGKMENGKFRFLVEDYRVFYTNRMDMFRQKEGADKDISNMAAFGNPDKSLVYAAKEVQDIQKISNAKQVLVEDKATEQEARTALVQKKYIHFATHGTLDYVKPKQSYLTFTATPGLGDDGRLTIAEIDSLKAPGQYAELVTLSACETARPLAISDDWYVSPANSFLRKKFKTVVASLWQVNDEATGLLMTEFYKNLQKMDKVDALRMAQQKLSANPKYTHPYFWGGFVLYGDWR